MPPRMGPPPPTPADSLNAPPPPIPFVKGREGLVDTAVKTAETGYMSRRLMKALEGTYALIHSAACPLLPSPSLAP